MIARSFLMVLSAALLALAPVPAGAQGVDPNTPVASDGTVGTAPAVQAQAGGAEPGYRGVAEAATLPERAVQPRTLRAHWHVFIAFAVTWLLLFGYALSLGRRWARLEREVARGGS